MANDMHRSSGTVSTATRRQRHNLSMPYFIGDKSASAGISETQAKKAEADPTEQPPKTVQENEQEAHQQSNKRRAGIKTDEPDQCGKVSVKQPGLVPATAEDHESFSKNDGFHGKRHVVESSDSSRKEELKGDASIPDLCEDDSKWEPLDWRQSPTFSCFSPSMAFEFTDDDGMLPPDFLIGSFDRSNNNFCVRENKVEGEKGAFGRRTYPPPQPEPGQQLYFNDDMALEEDHLKLTS